MERCAYPTVIALIATSALMTAVRPSAQQTDRRLTRSDAADIGRRVALVVGNDAYSAAPLKNARNDARAVAEALRGVGFSATMVVDAKRGDFGAALSAFGRDLTDRDTALFYYAGHGLQIEGENYLVPVDFSGQSEDSARWDTIPVARIHDVMRKARVSLIVLDACRNNPYGGARSSGGGLAPMEARGSLIAFAAGAGQTASDNAATGNGLFTTQFLAALRTPGLGVREVFRRAREQVVQATNGRQFPAVYDGLVGDFTFRDGGRADPGGTGLSDDVARREEVAFWESIGLAREPATVQTMLEEYIRSYPAGRFSVLARSRLAEITKRPTVSSTGGATSLNDPTLTGDTAQLQGACDAGDALGCRQLAIRYDRGRGVALDVPRAAQLYRRGCEMRDTFSCDQIGASVPSVVVSSPTASAWSPDKTSRALGEGAAVQVYEARSNQLLWKTSSTLRWESQDGPQPNGEITALVFSQESLRLLFSGDRVGRVCALNAQTGQLKWWYHIEPPTAVSSLSLSPDGRQLTVTAAGSTLVFDAATGALR